MKKPNEVERDDDFFADLMSPCCGRSMTHHLGKLLGKPYQSWKCERCGLGWNNTVTEIWNYKAGSSVGQNNKTNVL